MIGIVGRNRADGHSSFVDLINYIQNKPPERVLYSGMQNIVYTESPALEMESVALQNKRCANPVMHLILSWREKELPTEEQMKEAVDITLKEMGLSECQALWALHGDTQNAHLHIAVNRVHPEKFNAVNAAGGYTINAMHRAARIIELSQGWEIEQNGAYYVTPEGEIVRKGNSQGESISKPAGDMEAHTGQKSAERIAKETAASIIRNSQTWEELHKGLAAENIALERKGSGAVLSIGDIFVKLSTAGRDISLSKLEKQLGVFRSRGESIIIGHREPDAIDKVEKNEVKNEWDHYIAERNGYFPSKKEAFSALSKSHKEEYRELKEEQKKERDILKATSWKGRGNRLNAERSLMAARQASAMLNMRDKQKKEREELRSSYGKTFPSFKKWLENEKTPKPSIDYRYRDKGAIYGESDYEAQSNASGLHDLRYFWTKTSHLGRVIYTRPEENNAQFIDNGRKIIVYNSQSDEVILAALQLAQQKWAGVHIDGSDEYIKKCLEIARENNIRIANYDTRKDIKPDVPAAAGKIERSDETVSISKRETFELYADAVGADKFRIVVTEFSPEKGTSAFIYDRKNGGMEGKTKQEIVGAIPKFAVYTYYQKNINIVPMSADKHHIVVDDLTGDNLKRFKEDGYSPACVIESSPGNFQVVLTVPSTEGDREKDREAANRLAKELNVEYGDKNLSGALHPHRLPPFPNFKPIHKQEDGTYPTTCLIEANGGTCEKAKGRLEALQQEYKEHEQQEKTTREIRERTYSASHSHADDPYAAYWSHARDIISRQGVSDFSRLDGMIGIRMRVTGYGQSQIESAIESNGPALRKEQLSAEEFSEKYGNRNWHKYAIETTDNFIFGSRGHEAFTNAEGFEPYFLKIEGRSYKEEHMDDNRETESQKELDTENER